MELENKIYNTCMQYWNHMSTEYLNMLKRISKKIKKDNLTNDNVKVDVLCDNSEYYVNVLLYNGDRLIKTIKHTLNKEETMLITDNNQILSIKGKKASKLKYFETINNVKGNNSLIDVKDKIYERNNQNELLLALDCYLEYEHNLKILMKTKCNNRTFRKIHQEKVKQQQEYIELISGLKENKDFLLSQSIKLVYKKHSK